MLGKVYKGFILIDNMNNKIILTIFVMLFLMSFVQAEVFGIQQVSCPEPVVCDTPKVVDCEEPKYFTVIIVSFIVGGLVTVLAKTYGKNLFRKKKKKSILDVDNGDPTNSLFEEASNEIKEENMTGTRFRW